jgi:hypothetical protein
MRHERIPSTTRGRVGLLAASLLLTLPAAAGASLGTGVGASPIMLAHTAMPGHTYPLPGLYVLNTGTQTSRYHVRLERLSPGEARTLPAAWVTLQRNDFVLRPNHSATVPVAIRIPGNAQPGAYLSDLVASTSSPRRAGGTALGAAAATKLGLNVGSAPGLIPWKTVGPALLALLALAAGGHVIRRSGLRLKLERG